MDQRIIERDGCNQNWKGMRIKISIILNQFHENSEEVEGSKIEKIFAIIFNFS